MIMYGIPNCDTVKKAQKFLEANEIEFEFHNFKKQGLNLETVQKWLESQPIEVLVNKRSTSWKQLTDTQKEQLLSEEDLTVLTEMPTLIKRPVLETDAKLLVGFKADEYQQILS